MRKEGIVDKSLYYSFLLVIFTGLIFGCKDSKKESEDNEKIPSVSVAYPFRDSVILTDNYSGMLSAHLEVDIMARVDGILKIHVPSGSRVSRGQLLYSIENSKYHDAVREAEASLATAKSSFAYYTRQYDAMQKAYESRAVSEIELLQTKNNLEASEASIRSNEAILENAKTIEGYTYITAPFDGVISLQDYDNGAYINGETNPVKLNTIYNDDTMYVYISVDEKSYSGFQDYMKENPDNPISLKIGDENNAENNYEGKINYVAPQFNRETATVTLRFDIDNKGKELKSGMFANVRLPVSKETESVFIKAASIGTDKNGDYVYLVDSEDCVVYRPVKAGKLYQDTLRIVTEGLTLEDRYVTEALLKVKDGMKVKPIMKR